MPRNEKLLLSKYHPLEGVGVRNGCQFIRYSSSEGLQDSRVGNQPQEDRVVWGGKNISLSYPSLSFLGTAEIPGQDFSGHMGA